MLNPTAEPRREECKNKRFLLGATAREEDWSKVILKSLKDGNFKHEIISTQGIYGYVFMV